MTTPPNTASTPEPPCEYTPGDRIRITRGTLAGLRGKVTWLRDLNHCVLMIDGVTEGVYVIVNRRWLERLEEC